MGTDLHKPLQEAMERDALPAALAYNRIDGPGSSLDLREFQQAMWSMCDPPVGAAQEPAAAWTRSLPRTVGITIDVGTRIEARPFDPGLIGVRSVEYGTDTVGKPGEVPPIKENWLLKILEAFGLSGVQFVLQNLRPGIQSSGLGGSATATTGVCLLANELAGRPLSGVQLVSMASRMEQDLGVSLTGTQEQSNVVFGGVVDYVWFPWGVPGRPESGYGESLRFEILPPEDYGLLEERIAVFHTGRTRASTDVNSAWMEALATPDGYRLHGQKLEIAYRFREGLRLRDWAGAISAMADYRKVRTELCAAYMEGADEMLELANAHDCEAFPLGAGGGGAVFILAPDPDALKAVREGLKDSHREIPFRLKTKGHELVNLPLG